MRYNTQLQIFMGRNPEGVYQPRNIAEQGQKNICLKMNAPAMAQQYSHRRNKYNSN